MAAKKSSGVDNVVRRMVWLRALNVADYINATYGTQTHEWERHWFALFVEEIGEAATALRNCDTVRFYNEIYGILGMCIAHEQSVELQSLMENDLGREIQFSTEDALGSLRYRVAKFRRDKELLPLRDWDERRESTDMLGLLMLAIHNRDVHRVAFVTFSWLFDVERRKLRKIK